MFFSRYLRVVVGSEQKHSSISLSHSLQASSS